MFEIREDREVAAATEHARTLLASVGAIPELDQVTRAMKYVRVAEQTVKAIGPGRRLWYWLLERVRLRAR